MKQTEMKPLRIVLLGTHGQRNIGDELLLETFLDQLGSQHSYVINTYDIDYTRSQLAGRYDVELIDTAKDRRALLRALQQADCLVFAGGSIVKELNRRTTGRSPYATMLMLLAIVIYAKWFARIPRAMLNIGVGPIRTSRGRRLAKAILGQVDLVTVRDWRSFELARSIAPKADHIKQATDAVWSDDSDWFLGARDASSRREDMVASSDRPETPVTVALNLNSDLADKDVLERFTSTLRQAFEQVAAALPVELHLLPMQEGFKEHDDVEILDEFAAGLDGVTVVRHRPSDAHEVAQILDRCDVLVSERLHAIVIASILGVPSLPLAYDVKVLALADQLGLDDRVIDITKPFTAVHASQLLTSTIEGRQTRGTDVARRATSLRTEARQNFAAARDWMASQAK